MFILAIQSLQASPGRQDISWLQLSGIHGAPRIAYQMAGCFRAGHRPVASARYATSNAILSLKLSTIYKKFNGLRIMTSCVFLKRYAAQRLSLWGFQ
ncbi:hypothetical protein L211DRAFT_560738 [Terfezia boudieri ATCC MYA-4762]|uniref:Uncharacterized protein n=1 Tax=Terfezia boudieri ATCC MYA-4762 TaxID=1051890 RepID=A0A3N4LXJ5_9PEZI|nr:hypothetical protein L211DRAFT_560738 [Terfezia boudieri ATCC MYA-4762]